MISNINIDAVCSIAQLAGDAIMKIYQEKDFSTITDFKADNSPLTLADKNAHEVIVHGLQTLYPAIPIISEEGENIEHENRKDWKTYWLIDPLDGTKEFIKRNGEFTVNIALIENNHPVLGIIFVPVTQVLYWGGESSGSFKKLAQDTKSIKVSNRTQSLTAVGSRSHAGENKLLLKYDIKQEINIGSSLKFCMVAEGIADIYLRENPTMEWDTAAGQAILEGAGGKMTTIEGLEFPYNKMNMLNGGFVCVNEEL